MAGPGSWIAFHAVIFLLLAVDLGLLGRQPGTPSFRHAAAWSALWIALGLGFGVLVFTRSGNAAGAEYLTAYLLEKSLSVDNLFVFTLIFASLRIPVGQQQRVLLWGVLGALVMRGAMIAAGAALVDRFEWILYVFGGFLVVTAWRMWRSGPAHGAGSGRTLRRLGRIIPIAHGDRSGRFFVRAAGRRRRLAATPLLVALVLVESADIAFAVDSIPAVFAVTRDPFIVYTSNVLAVLGLRALYFLLAGSLDRFRYLRHGLALILLFIGCKMVLSGVLHVPVGASLLFVSVALAASILASMRAGRGGTAGGTALPPLTLSGDR